MLSSQSKETLMYECMVAAAHCLAAGGTEAQAISRSVAIVRATLAAEMATTGTAGLYTTHVVIDGAKDKKGD